MKLIKGIKMHKNKLSLVLMAIASTSAFAGGFEVQPQHQKMLFVEAGLAYTHSFYVSSHTSVESYTTSNPSGTTINPNDYYPNNFWGGYIGTSLYLPVDILINTKFDMYASKTKSYAPAQTSVSMSLTKLSFTIDKVYGDINTTSYGIGGGAVFQNLNNGSFRITPSSTNPPSEVITGRSRIDPVVEAFAMYRFANNLSAKLNVAYQIPFQSELTHGAINATLGINYSFPI